MTRFDDRQAFDGRRKVSTGRRAVLVAAAVLLTGSAIPGSAMAQADYPDKPIKLVMAYSPGGMSDISARTIAEPLSKILGQPIVVENRPGAASTVASQWVARQPADGYTLYAAPTSLVVNPILQGSVQYDPRKDFAPISMMIDSPFVLQVNPEVKATNMKELLALIKANPGKLSIGTSGVGSINHLAAEQFIRTFGLDMNVVHYKGGAPASQDLVGGSIQMMFSAANEAAPLIRANRTRGIAVSTSRRLTLLPELPTVEEAAGIPGFEAVYWMALVAPAGTPQPVLDKIGAAMAKLGTNVALRDDLAAKGVELHVSSPQEVAAVLDRDEQKWGKLIRDLGLKQ